jgi:hypothetical protein
MLQAPPPAKATATPAATPINRPTMVRRASGANVSLRRSSALTTELMPASGADTSASRSRPASCGWPYHAAMAGAQANTAPAHSSDAVTVNTKALDACASSSAGRCTSVSWNSTSNGSDAR